MSGGTSCEPISINDAGDAFEFAKPTFVVDGSLLQADGAIVSNT